VAVVRNLYQSASVPQRLQVAALVSYAAVFSYLLEHSRPGAGIGQGFYVAIVLGSVAGDAVTRAAAGLRAWLLYEIAITWGGSAGLTTGTCIHLLVYVAVGVLVGHFARRARMLLSEALHSLDDLLHLARRDLETGTLNPSGLQDVLARRIDERRRFGLVVGEVDCSGGAVDDVLRASHEAIAAQLGSDAEIARVGPKQLAAIVSSASLAGARREASDLERTLHECGVPATFGWTLYPDEGDDALALFRSASERLYARRVVRGEWVPTAASAELVDELGPRLPAV